MGRALVASRSFVNHDYQTDGIEIFCSVPDATYYTVGYWSTDAYLTYDIDGEGSCTWNLAGTPLW